MISRKGGMGHLHYVTYFLNFKVALGVSPQFFPIWTRVLNHNKYVEIKQFSKEDIKQNNILFDVTLFC